MMIFRDDLQCTKSALRRTLDKLIRKPELRAKKELVKEFFINFLRADFL